MHRYFCQVFKTVGPRAYDDNKKWSGQPECKDKAAFNACYSCVDFTEALGGQ